ATEGQQSVRAGLDAAIDPAREMYSEEREARIGNRVNKRPYQVAPLWLHFVIFSAEGDDFEVGLHSGHAGDRVAIQAGTIDHVSCPEAAGAGLHDIKASVLPQSEHLGAKHNLASGSLNQ